MERYMDNRPSIFYRNDKNSQPIIIGDVHKEYPVYGDLIIDKELNILLIVTHDGEINLSAKMNA